ncbi:HD domain-containing phosphohydrolase [uncultured Paraglaciecola sp.]|uniref:HD-GYP domain-containing protein n=1 Tax=uncultured Paraglaciecola sp. TaxID=1765024 RepID=UPI0030DD2B0F|tara:strand:+ start:28588 stop:29631 length:1044 start_codon:yes stop_codon:yes gene_type:complete
MSAGILEKLYADLNFAVFATTNNELFSCITDPPIWLKHFYPSINKGSQLTQEELPAFLQHFIFDAQDHWQRKQQGHLNSGLWVEEGPDDADWHLEATAILVDNNKLLLLSFNDKDHHSIQEKQQLMRENLLTQEKLELEVHRRTQQIRDREEEIAIRLISAAVKRDEETGAHIRRIGLYSAEMAMELGWPLSQIEDIKLAAPMHDIGKIGIPDNILQKPGRLTEAEFEIMKDHSRIGGEMLAGSGIPMLDIASSIAYYHHEKWDGSGYPEGLKGEEIPEAARIVAIVDVYDALVHKRVYKKAIPEAEALTIMEDMTQNHLDPKLFRVFLSILDRIRKIKQQNQDEDL